jgi:hypothetical protein
MTESNKPRSTIIPPACSDAQTTLDRFKPPVSTSVEVMRKRLAALTGSKLEAILPYELGDYFLYGLNEEVLSYFESIPASFQKVYAEDKHFQYAVRVAYNNSDHGIKVRLLTLLPGIDFGDNELPEYLSA